MLDNPYVLIVASAVVALAVNASVRRWVVPDVWRPIRDHRRDDQFAAVASVVLSPKMQRDLRESFEQVVTSEAGKLAAELTRLGVRVERLERGQGDLTTMVRDIRDNGGHSGV